MSNSPERSLKSLNFKWHIALATADAILLALFVAPELFTTATTTQLGTYRALSAVLVPVVVLLLMNVLPSNVKAMLVYWKPLGVLPGCEAFSRHAHSDPRVNIAQLKKNVGALPSDPKEQNAMWYKLYKKVESRTEVATAQKDFLMYRDMAVLSLPLMVLVPLCMLIAGVGYSGVWITTLLFFLQYLVTAISARHAGVSFVCNVLAIHSASKITTSK